MQSCHVGDSTSAERSLKLKTLLIFDSALSEAETQALMNALTVYPEIIEEIVTYNATLDTVFRNPQDYTETTQENPVHIVPEPGKMIYYQVSLGSSVIYLDLSAYATVNVNCSGFTRISDKLYSITGSFFPWITSSNHTQTTITINQD